MKRLSATTALSLADFCPDLDSWARSWCIEPRDMATGQAIVAAITPFLQQLMHRSLSRKTRQRHRDNLWSLGGEIIRRLHDQPRLRNRPAIEVVQSFVGEDGGPLLYPYTEDNESVQRSLDATCRQLYAFFALQHQ